MASTMMRLKWWLQTRLSIHKHDVFIVLTFLACALIVLYVVILHYDDPDVTDLSHVVADDEDFIKEALEELQNRNERVIYRNLVNPGREKAIADRVQEKLKYLTTLKPSKIVVSKSERVVEEDELKLALIMEDVEEHTNKDEAYWLDKYKHVFHRGFELEFNIQAPMDVALKGGKAQCTIYDHTAEVNHTYDCVKLQVKSKPTICLYPSASDVHLSRYIRMEGIWEPHIVKLFTNYLSMDPNMGFIDIGANIGVYTLTAAALGHKVIAIEPYDENLKHLSQGLQLSDLDNNVIVLQNAISDTRLNYVDLRVDPTNQGGIHVDESNHNFRCYGDNCPPQAKTIFMDDLLEVANFKSAVIKIDIEGYEHRAFRESKQLFEHLYVPCIIMEWLKLREYYGTEIDESEDKTMVHELVEYLTEQGYQAFSMVTMQKLHPAYWYAWPDDVVWKHLLVGVV